MTIENSIICIHPGHNINVCVYDHTTDEFHHFELEKKYGIKHLRVFSVSEYPYPLTTNLHNSPKERYPGENRISYGLVMTDIMDMLDGWKSIHTGDKPPVIIYSRHDKPIYNSTEGRIIHQYFFDQYPKKKYTPYFYDLRHHFGHMCTGYYQSPYDNCFILSVDGGSHEGCTWTGYATKEQGVTQHRPISTQDKNTKKMHPVKIGKVYNLVGQCLNIIPTNGMEQLDWAGKVMGLSAYGNYNKELYSIVNRYLNHTTPIEQIILYKKLKEYYQIKDTDVSFIERHMADRVRFTQWSGFVEDDIPRGLRSYVEDQKHYIPKMSFIENLQDQMDIAYNLQRATEDTVVNLVKTHLPMIKKYDNNLVLTGGVALNVLMNQRIKEEFPYINVFVPPNPNDMGLSYGLLRQYMQQQHKYTKKTRNIQYNGPEIQDKEMIFKRPGRGTTNVRTIARMLKDGKIIGLIQGGAELGPRALGNRSILCNAMRPNMKDIINEKVKMREWYRPFAPVCKLEDAPKYFDSINFDNMEFMSFAVKTKSQYKYSLQSVTHEDGTARLQTVTEEQNKLLYDILDEMDGVLLNTSFNVRGKPILNSLEDAFWVLDNTELDHVVVKEYGLLWLF